MFYNPYVAVFVQNTSLNTSENVLKLTFHLNHLYRFIFKNVKCCLTLNYQNFELENNLLQIDKKSGKEKMSRCALPPEDK